MTNWWWVRHGPTHEKAFTGWRDVPADLTDTTRIMRLRQYLPKNALVVSSDLIRAVATADAIADGRNRLPHSPELREFNFGDWDGLTFEEVAALDPALSRAYWETPGDISPPNGESWNAASKRVTRFVTTLNTLYPARDIIAVAHAGTIMTQIQNAGCLTPQQAILNKIDNLSVTLLSWQEDRGQIQMINHIP